MGLENIIYGLSSFADTTRDLQDRDLKLKNEAETRKRQTAIENLHIAQLMAPGLITQNPEAASHTLNAVRKQLRDAGFPVPDAPIVGGLKKLQHPDATPTQGPLSVMPQAPAGGLGLPQSYTLQEVLKSRLDGAPSSYGEMMTQGLNAGPTIGDFAPMAPESVSDFSNPQTTRSLYAGFGVQMPRPDVQIKPTGNGGYLKITTNPDGTTAIEEHKAPAKATTPKPVQDPVSGQWFTPQPGMITHTKPAKTSGSKGTAPKAPKLQTKVIQHADGKNYIYLFNPNTGHFENTGNLAGSQPKKGSDGFSLDDPAASPAPTPTPQPTRTPPPPQRPKPKAAAPKAKAVMNKFGL